MSVTGDVITYPPLAHLPRSSRRQRSLQKGKSGSPDFTGFLQIGQRSFRARLRGIGKEVRGPIAEFRSVLRRDCISLLIVTSDLLTLTSLLTLNDFCHQIIVVGGGDAAAVDSPSFGSLPSG